MASLINENVNENEKNKLTFYSVSGNSSTRRLRSSLLQECANYKENYILSNSSYNSNNKWFIPNIIDKVIKSNNEIVEKPLEISENDILLLIGRIETNELVYHLRNKKINFYGMGPGFNFNDRLAMELKNDGSKINLTTQDMCPRFTHEQWNELLELYPEPLKKLREYQIGGFWLSRNIDYVKMRYGYNFLTSSFYNQWGLNTILDPKNNPEEKPNYNLLIFEKHIWNQAKELFLEENDGEKMIEAFSEFENILNNIDKEYKTIKDTFNKIYNTYNVFYKKFEYFNFFKYFTKALLMNISSIGNKLSKLKNQDQGIDFMTGFKSEGIKEYDSYTIHCCLIGGYPNKIDHFNLVRHCLRSNNYDRSQVGQPVLTYNPYLDEFKSKVKENIGDKNIVCLHDIGLDPQNDDWLAIELLLAVFHMYM